MNINQYEVFLKTVKVGNITKAADAMGYTQSGVSLMINSMEKELNLVLLNRNRSGVSLTSSGEKLLPLIREVVNANQRLSQTASAINGLEAGVLRIGVLNSISVHYLPPILKAFDVMYPNVEFELFQGFYGEIENWIWEGAVDCGFVCMPVHRDLETIELLEDKLLVVADREHPFNQKERISIQDMKEELFVLSDGETDYDFTNLFKDAGFIPHVKFTTENDYATMAMIRQGLGITLLPELIVEDYKEVLCVKETENHFSRTIGVAVKSMKRASPLTKIFIETLQKWEK